MGFDLFGHQPVLTIKGEGQSRSIIGTLVSLMVYVVFLAYTYQQLILLIYNGDPTIQISETLRDMDDLSSFSPKEAGFDFAFSLKRDLDPSIAYFDVKQIREYYLANGTKLNETKNMTIQKCNAEQFNYQNKTQLKSIKLDENYYCLNEGEEYSVTGNNLSPEFVYLQLRLLRCQNGVYLPSSYPTSSSPSNVTSSPTKTIIGPLGQTFQSQLTSASDLSSLKCSPNVVLDAILNNQKFYFVFVNKNFVPSSIDEPINSFLDDSIYYDMESGKNKKADLLVKQQAAELLDDVWQITPPKEIEFPQVSNIRFYEQTVSSNDPNVITINIKLDKAQTTYARTAYSVLNFLGDIGGLQGILFLIGFYIASSISEQMYYKQIIEETIQVKDKVPKQKQKNKSKVKPMASTTHHAISNCESNNTTIKVIEQSNGVQDIINSKPKRSLCFKSKKKEKVIYFNQDLKQLSSHQNQFQNQEDDDEKITMISQRELLKKISNSLTSNILNTFHEIIQKSILKRYKFTYSADAIIGYVFKINCIVKTICCCCKRQRREIKLLTKSQDQINNDLCVINIINGLKKVKLMEKLLFNKFQRTLLKHQKDWVLSSSSESEPDVDKELIQ
ncbi:UNKNOWN [Stylonychia lemnae]|uniref:Transmembrane protein n=1 Tax=Stylonychia lemnae TaxID=5949 RepID=A0A078A634_STYLE|nr:UNKNOWN [Stylonychia lemnae]|eukprot:CDW76214.1 UNKNOWN [Stylonychia lemnae]